MKTGVSADVFEVESESDKQHYGQKRLVLFDDGMVDAFKKQVLFESRERQSLQHPFILPLKESYNDKHEVTGSDYHFVVMELASGGTLEESIAKRRKEERAMTEQELMGLFASIILGMEETHAQG